MTKFTLFERVQLIWPAPLKLLGRYAKVVRLVRDSSIEAWVDVEDGLPDEFRAFDRNDKHGRSNNLLITLAECRPAQIEKEVEK